MILHQTLEWEELGAELLALRKLARHERAIHGRTLPETMALIDGAILRAAAALDASDFLKRLTAKG
jgi:hypothetical protein